jgi:predicted nucleic acid-binding protein
MSLVVDTSVVLKWIAAEDDSERATMLISRTMIAPDLIRAELANALWKKVALRGEISAEQANRGLDRALSLVATVPIDRLAQRSLALAIELLHPVYDCFFLALAEQADMPLVTADVRLVQRLEGTPYRGRVESLSQGRSE